MNIAELETQAHKQLSQSQCDELEKQMRNLETMAQQEGRPMLPQRFDPEHGLDVPDKVLTIDGKDYGAPRAVITAFEHLMADVNKYKAEAEAARQVQKSYEDLVAQNSRLKAICATAIKVLSEPFGGIK